jgi:hypothetical protein
LLLAEGETDAALAIALRLQEAHPTALKATSSQVAP